MSEHPTIKVSKRLQEVAGKLDALLAEIAGEPVAFSLFVWTKGRSNYISTADRAECIHVIQAHLDGWKKCAPDVPAHEVQ